MAIVLLLAGRITKTELHGTRRNRDAMHLDETNIVEISQLELCIREELEREHGLVVGGKALWKSLGYPSSAAFRRAHERGQLPIQVFKIPYRRGAFALARHVARWLAGVLEAAKPAINERRTL